MAHEYSKEARASHERKLKAYGEGAKGEPKNFAGFPALNTNKQAGMAPLDKPEELSTETAPRIMRKAGGVVKGAASLKRLDKAKRVGKGLGGARKGPIPTPMEQEEEFDATTYRKPGYMSEVARRQKGGKVENEVEDEDEGHEDEPMDRELVKKMVKKEALTGKSHGGRAHRAEGGSLGDGKKSSMKGRTTINVIVGTPEGMGQMGQGRAPAMTGMTPGPGGAPMTPPPPPPPMMGAPMMPPPGPGGGMPMPPPGGMPPMPPGGMPMPRKDGGKVQVPYKKPGRKGEYPAMDFGSGGGFGRKQKIDAYGEGPTKSKNNY